MIFSYILLGISLSAPVGPINVAQINKGIKNGFLSAWLVGVGAMSAGVVMMFLIYFGISTYLTTPIAQLCIWIFGFVTMIYLGYESMKEATKQVQYISSGEKEHPLKSFLSGFAIAISNPLNIIFWIGIYGSVLTSAMNYFHNFCGHSCNDNVCRYIFCNNCTYSNNGIVPNGHTRKYGCTRPDLYIFTYCNRGGVCRVSCF